MSTEDRTQSELAEAPIEVAAAVAVAAEERTRALGLPLPEDCGAVLSIFRRAAAARDLPHHGLEPDPRSGLGEYRQLLAHPAYQYWFFDRGDLAGAGVLLPRDGLDLPAGWMSDAARGLARTDVPRRLEAMCEHMALWHALRREQDLARLCLAGARATADCFAESPLVEAMLERSIPLSAQMQPPPGRRSDPALRVHLKHMFFGQVCHPTGRDLARLDLAEAAFPVVEGVLNLLPGARRPRLETQYAIAFAVSEVAADLTRFESDELLEATAMRAITGASDLSADEAERIVSRLLLGVMRFIEEVCADCPVACLVRLDEEMTAAFFSPDHPALDRSAPAGGPTPRGPRAPPDTRRGPRSKKRTRRSKKRRPKKKRR